MAGGMTLPDYASMTLAQLVRAVARLLFSPMGVSGDAFVVTKLNDGVGQCVPMPGERTRTPLLLAMLAQIDPVPGDTATETEMRGWLSDLCDWGAESGYMNPATALGGGGVRQMLRNENYTLARRYHDLPA